LRTTVYIDGFNLYYAIRRTPYKWLNISAFCKKLLPNHDIKKIRYFTAIVKPLPHDPNAPIRQATYLRALRTLSDFEIHDKGHFVQWPRLLPQYPLAYKNPNNPTRPPQAVQILKAEEKGSDVNLASFLLKDCFSNDFDEAVVISNDSDLTTPIEIVVKDCGKPVMIVNPHLEKYLSRQLISVASDHRRTINMSVYRECQFPQSITDSIGTFTKPPTW
jgi:uncharacterized LabA/DUF88 family protein